MAIDNFPSLPSVLTEKLDGNLRFTPVSSGPVTLILGTAARGPVEPTSLTRIGDAFSIFGREGTLIRGLEESAAFGASNPLLHRVGARSATLMNVGGDGNLIQTVAKDNTAADDYEIVYLAPNQIGSTFTIGRLRVRNKFGTVVYDNFAGVQATLDAGEVYVTGTFTETLSQEDFISSTDSDWISMREVAADNILVEGEALGTGDGSEKDFSIAHTLLDPFSLEVYLDEKKGELFGTSLLGEFDYGPGASDSGDLGRRIAKDINGGGVFPEPSKYALCLHRIDMDEVTGSGLTSDVIIRFKDLNGSNLDGSGNTYRDITLVASSTKSDIVNEINSTSTLNQKLFAVEHASANQVYLFDIQDPESQDSGKFYVFTQTGTSASVHSQNPDDKAVGNSTFISFAAGTNVITNNSVQDIPNNVFEDGWGITPEVGDYIEIFSAGDSRNIGSGYIISVAGDDLALDRTLYTESAGAEVAYRISDRQKPFVRMGTAPGGETAVPFAVSVAGIDNISAHAGKDITNDLFFEVGEVSSATIAGQAKWDELSLSMVGHAIPTMGIGGGDRQNYGFKNGVLDYQAPIAPAFPWSFAAGQVLRFEYRDKFLINGAVLNSRQHSQGNALTVTVAGPTANDQALAVTPSANEGFRANLTVDLGSLDAAAVGAISAVNASGSVQIEAATSWDLSNVDPSTANGQYIFITAGTLAGQVHKVLSKGAKSVIIDLAWTGQTATGAFFLSNGKNLVSAINTLLLTDAGLDDEAWSVVVQDGSKPVQAVTSSGTLSSYVSGKDAGWKFNNGSGEGSLYNDMAYQISTAENVTFATPDQITMTSDFSTHLSKGMLLQFPSSGLNTDVYTVESVAGTVITVQEQTLAAEGPVSSEMEILGLAPQAADGKAIRVRGSELYSTPAGNQNIADVLVTADRLYWVGDYTAPDVDGRIITGNASNITLFDADNNSVTLDTITYVDLSDEDDVDENIVIVEADDLSANYRYDKETRYDLEDGKDGANLSLMETFEAFQRAYRDLEAIDLDVVLPQGVKLDSLNVADGDTVALSFADSNPVGRHYPSAGSAGDALGKVYIEEIGGELEFWWDVDGDGVGEIFPLGHTGNTSPLRPSSDPLVAADFHEVNFGWQAADFCFNLAINDNEAFACIGVKSPVARSLASINSWVGKSPTYNQAGQVTNNGSGLLGNKFMAGRIGRDRGFFATSSGYMPTSGDFKSDSDVLKDGNEEMIDIGKYLRVVAGQGLFRNSFDETGFGYINSGASAVGGLLSNLSSSIAMTNQRLSGLQPAFNLNREKLNSLSGARYIAFKSLNDVAVIVDGPTASRATSDYNRDTTFRIVSEALERTRIVAIPFIGKGASSLRVESLNNAIDTELNSMKVEGSLLDFRRQTVQTPEERAQGIVNISLELVVAFEIRKIIVKVGLALQ